VSNNTSNYNALNTISAQLWWRNLSVHRTPDSRSHSSEDLPHLPNWPAPVHKDPRTASSCSPSGQSPARVSQVAAQVQPAVTRVRFRTRSAQDPRTLRTHPRTDVVRRVRPRTSLTTVPCYRCIRCIGSSRRRGWGGKGMWMLQMPRRHVRRHRVGS
jgi:hypothetical protein